MPIVASKAHQIHELIGRLGSQDEVRRESAIARLTLLGERATEALLQALPRASQATRLGILTVLEATGDRRGLSSILAQLESSEPAVVLRAVAAATTLPDPRTAQALARLAGHPDPAVRRSALDALLRLAKAGYLEALDALLGLLFDERAALPSRLAALPVVDQVTGKDRRILLRDLRAIPALAERVAAMEKSGGARPQRRPRAVAPATAASLIESLLARPGDLQSALETGRALCQLDAGAEPAVRAALERTSHLLPLRMLADALGHWRQPASLPALRQLLDRLTTAPGDPAGVAEVKARIHLVLADMGSRIALYDLREMLEARPVLAAPSLLRAAAAVGDSSFLPALAALAGSGSGLLDDCRRAFAAIAGREKLRRGSKAAKAVRPEHREGLARLWKR